MSKSQALLMTTGYIRLSSDLLPENISKKDSCFLIPDSEHKTLGFKLALNGEKGPWLKRHFVFSNKHAKSPMVTIRLALSLIGMRPPKKDSVEYEVKKKKNGTLVIQF